MLYFDNKTKYPEPKFFEVDDQWIININFIQGVETIEKGKRYRIILNDQSAYEINAAKFRELKVMVEQVNDDETMEHRYYCFEEYCDLDKMDKCEICKIQFEHGRGDNQDTRRMLEMSQNVINGKNKIINLACSYLEKAPWNKKDMKDGDDYSLLNSEGWAEKLMKEVRNNEQIRKG